MMVLVFIAVMVAGVCIALYRQYYRYRRLSRALHSRSLRGVFRAQRSWLLALAVCVGLTGVLVWSDGAHQNHAQVLLFLIGGTVLLEGIPAYVLGKWRRALKQGEWVSLGGAAVVRGVSLLQGVALLAILVIAAQMLAAAFA